MGIWTAAAEKWPSIYLAFLERLKPNLFTKILSTRLFAIGYGERKPLATNMYKAGRKQNRRVEINLVK